MLRQIPNLLTLLRIFLVIPFALYFLQGRYDLALLLFVIAGVSDGVDGFVARQFGWHSRFGAIADPLADKLLLVSTFIILAWLEYIPIWLFILVFGRDLLLVCGALFFHFRIAHYDVKPSYLGKACTFIQIAFAAIMLLYLSGYLLNESYIDVGIASVSIITFLSGIHYIYLWVKEAKFALNKGVDSER